MPAALYVEDLIAAFRKGGERFRYGLDQVPDDRLHWSPGGDAKTPLQVAAKLARHARLVTHGLRERSLPADRSVFDVPPFQTREEAHAALQQALGDMAALLSGLTEADLEQPMQAPWGEMLPLRRYLPFTLAPLSYFQGQLNYAQTAYGDLDPNIPPSWRPPAGS